MAILSDKERIAGSLDFYDKVIFSDSGERPRMASMQMTQSEASRTEAVSWPMWSCTCYFVGEFLLFLLQYMEILNEKYQGL